MATSLLALQLAALCAGDVLARYADNMPPEHSNSLPCCSGSGNAASLLLQCDATASAMCKNDPALLAGTLIPVRAHETRA
eukprot:6274903-Amphidinium_carterae.1